MTATRKVWSRAFKVAQAIIFVESCLSIVNRSMIRYYTLKLREQYSAQIDNIIETTISIISWLVFPLQALVQKFVSVCYSLFSLPLNPVLVEVSLVTFFFVRALYRLEETYLRHQALTKELRETSLADDELQDKLQKLEFLDREIQSKEAEYTRVWNEARINRKNMSRLKFSTVVATELVQSFFIKQDQDALPSRSSPYYEENVLQRDIKALEHQKIEVQRNVGEAEQGLIVQRASLRENLRHRFWSIVVLAVSFLTVSIWVIEFFFVRYG